MIYLWEVIRFDQFWFDQQLPMYVHYQRDSCPHLKYNYFKSYLHINPRIQINLNLLFGLFHFQNQLNIFTNQCSQLLHKNSC